MLLLYAVLFLIFSIVLRFLHYWLITITEGIFFGRRFVVYLYDREAHEYDDIKEYSLTDELILVVDPILGELNNVERPKVLDVGTGTGRVPQFLLDDGRFAFDRHGHVIGLDPSRKMLGFAQKNVEGLPGNVDFVRKNAVPLPFPDNTFDGVTSLETIEFFPDPEAALAEMVRVCKPGGFVMVTRRKEWEAYLFLHRYYSKGRYINLLEDIGLHEIMILLWQNNYDLVIGTKAAS